MNKGKSWALQATVQSMENQIWLKQKCIKFKVIFENPTKLSFARKRQQGDKAELFFFFFF